MKLLNHGKVDVQHVLHNVAYCYVVRQPDFLADGYKLAATVKKTRERKEERKRQVRKYRLRAAARQLTLLKEAF